MPNTLLSIATGNFTAAGTWGTCDATSELDSESAAVTLGTGNTDSGTFTPGAITVDAVALKLRTRAASPTGTLTVTLRNSTDATNVVSVTVNISDLPATVTDSGSNALNCGWLVFAFASQLLVAGKAYLIRATTSSASQVTLWGSSSTNMSRQLRTTTTNAPGASDKLLISGQMTAAATSSAYTVTMNETASTVYGTESLLQSVCVSHLGTLTWGVAASTNYLLKVAGIIVVAPGGTWNQGTNGSAMPSTSTGILDFSVTTNAASGMRVHGGTLNMYGAARDGIVTITSNAAASQAVVNVSSVTGWATSGDDVFVCPTQRVASQGEQKVVSSIATLAVTLTTNLSNAHAGNSALAPNAPRGHVLNLNRNVKIRGTDNTHRAFLYASNGSTVVLQYVEVKWVGTNTNYKYGIAWDSSGVSFTMAYCSVWLYGDVRALTVDWNGTTLTSNSFYGSDDYGLRLTQDCSTNTGWSVTGNLVCSPTGGANKIAFAISAYGGTFSNNIACGFDQGFSLGNVLISRPVGTFSGNEAYCNTSLGCGLGALPMAMVLTNTKVWRNAGPGISSGGSALIRLLFDTITAFGNSNGNLSFSTQVMDGWRIKALTSDSEASFTTNYGIIIGTNAYAVDLMLETCDFSQTQAHASGGDINFNNTPLPDIKAINCRFQTTPFTFGGASNWQSPYPGGIIRCQKYGRTAGDHRWFTARGQGRTDSVVYQTAAPSERLIPSQTVLKLLSSKKIRVADSGQTITVSVAVRKSVSTDAAPFNADYNGAQPRLMVRRNPAVGLDSDTVIDTMTVAIGNWETLTGSAPALSGDDGALEFYVDCDGTVGSINVDDWSFSVA